MICSSCGSDSPRASQECLNCGAKLNVVRCRCGFLNSLMDSFCGSCGKQLIKTTGISRIQRLESNIHTVPQFTEQELMRIIEVQQIHSTSEHSANAATQNDIDKLFE